MKRTFTCIVCPNGCEVEAEFAGKDVLSVSGNLCPKGKDYVTQELTDPRRTIASSVMVEGGELPLASVRLTRGIPKDRIYDAMTEIRKIRLQAPVKIGQVVIPNLLGLNSDVVVTKNVNAIQ